MAEPFTIRVFVADGDPEGVRLVDRMNWTGVGVVFPREQWQTARSRTELGRTGVYVLVGYKEGDEDLPTLYIGEGDAVRDRIDSHAQTKEFWEHGYAFTTSNNGLNKAHVRWLERELIQQAKKAGRSKLDNGTAPSEPPLSEAERADSRAFLREILQVLPIMGLRAFHGVARVRGTKACCYPTRVDSSTTHRRNVPCCCRSQYLKRCRGSSARAGRRLQSCVPWRAALACHPCCRRQAATNTLRGSLPNQTDLGRNTLCVGRGD